MQSGNNHHQLEFMDFLLTLCAGGGSIEVLSCVKLVFAASSGRCEK